MCSVVNGGFARASGLRSIRRRHGPFRVLKVALPRLPCCARYFQARTEKIMRVDAGIERRDGHRPLPLPDTVRRLPPLLAAINFRACGSPRLPRCRHGAPSSVTIYVSPHGVDSERRDKPCGADRLTTDDVRAERRHLQSAFCNSPAAAHHLPRRPCIALSREVTHISRSRSGTITHSFGRLRQSPAHGRRGDAH